MNINPAMGGDARDPTPHPRKNIEEMFPVTSTLLADQENNAPNCHERREAPETMRTEMMTMDDGLSTPARTDPVILPHMNPPL